MQSTVVYGSTNIFEITSNVIFLLGNCKTNHDIYILFHIDANKIAALKKLEKSLRLKTIKIIGYI